MKKQARREAASIKDQNDNRFLFFAFTIKQEIKTPKEANYRVFFSLGLP